MIYVIICSFEEVKGNIQKLITDRLLIPILGSGFTSGALAQKGKVATGEELRDYMLKLLKEREYVEEEDRKAIEKYEFSKIAGLYESAERISDDERRSYIKNNFFNVRLEEPQKEFLDINWPYIYTLNIDDGIERNSEFKKIISAFDDIDERIFDEAKCLIKLHGDVWQYLSAKKKLIFSQKDYLDSIKNNDALLNRVEYDMVHQNIAYIGCSLYDELDLRATTSKITGTDTNFRFYFTVKEPTQLKKAELKSFGITHIVLFSEYDDIYRSMSRLWRESPKKIIQCFQDCKVGHIKKILDYRSAENKDYFFWGKSLVNSEREAILPYYFINRGITSKIVEQIGSKNLVVIKGYACTGKTYILIDVLNCIKNRDVYYLQSKESISEQNLKEMLNLEHAVIIADDMSLSGEDIEYIIKHLEQLNKKDVHILYATNYRNVELFSILQLLNENKDKKMIYISNDICIDKCLDKKDTTMLNSKLNVCNIGTFFEGRSIIDNILHITKEIDAKNKYYNIKIHGKSSKDIAALILLAIRKKVYVKDCSDFSIYEEMRAHFENMHPVIDEERTEAFERSPRHNSISKFVLNGEVFLIDRLKEFARQSNNVIIAEAYEYLVKKSMGNKTPTVDYSDNKAYKDFILLDNINYLFGKQEAMSLISCIYEKLQALLGSDPSYKHQRAKCEIWFAKYTKLSEKKKEYYRQALDYIGGAILIYQKRYNESSNEKVNISLQHAKYTRALVYCNLCILENYNNEDYNKKAIKNTYDAFLTQYNSFEYAGKDRVNYNKAIEKMIDKMSTKSGSLDREYKYYLEYLLNKKFSISTNV